MTGPETQAPRTQKNRRRFWVTLGEAVAVLALVVAGLNYWDAHRARTTEAQQADVQARAKTAMVMTGSTDDAGDRVILQPLNAAQAVQSQRYLFPHEVLDHAMEVSAAKPQIDLPWIAAGLKHALDRDHAPATGEAQLPVGVITTYVQDGDTHVDRSLYRLGYSYRSGFLTGRKLTLQGVSLSRRSVAGDLQIQVEARWAARRHPASGA